MFAVAVLWIVFRADSWETVREFWRAVERWDWTGGHPIPDRNAYYALAVAMPVLFAVCWYMPNSIQLSKWARRQIRLADRAPRGALVWANLRRAYLPAVATGVFLYVAVASISHVKSEFLYFNF